MSDERNKQLQTAEVLWNLDDLYHGQEDEAFSRDQQWCEQEALAIAHRYCGRVATLGADELRIVLCRLEKLMTTLGRLSTYAFLHFSTQTRNAAAGALLQAIKELGSRVGKHTVFFELEWNALPQDQAATLLDQPELADFRHYLEKMRCYAPHQLSKAEETLLLEISPVGRSSWTNLFDKILGHLEFGSRRRSEEEVLADLYSPDRETRKEAAADLTTGLTSQLHVLTHIFNTLLADKMIDDRLRSYDCWLDTMNLYNELSADTVQTLVDTVTSRYDIVQRYYHIKRRMLGLDTLYDYDRYAPLPSLPEAVVQWPAARDMVLTAMDRFAPEMATIAEKFFSQNWLHAPLLEGKRGGAFAHPCTPDVHPYVLVNYTGNIRDVSTVAHELGHGVHQYLAADQGYFNADTPLVLAETASVFAELLLFRSQLDALETPQERKAFICQKLESIFATVFRQVSMNRFEDAIHNARRQQGELSTEALSGFWMTSQKAMFADSVTMTDDYGIWWSYIPHFISSPGYVYSYAFGELLVLALYNRYQQEGDSFVPKYLNLLRAGGSQSPYALMEPFDVDLNQSSFWAGGLDIIDQMLREVEELDES